MSRALVPVPNMLSSSPESSERDARFMEIHGGEAHRDLLQSGSWRILASLTRLNIVGRFRQSALHLAWIVVQPVAFVAVYAAFFKGVLEVDSGEVPYIAFVITGVIPWRFISSSISNTSCITDNIQVLSKVYFPKELIPLSITFANLIDLAVGTMIIVIVALFERSLSVYILLLPLVYLHLLIVTASFSILISTLSVFIRDIGHAMPFILIGLFFATPVMYTPDRLPRWFAVMNPFAVAIAQVRDVSLFGRSFSMFEYLIYLMISLVLFLSAIVYVRSVEGRMVDIA